MKETGLVTGQRVHKMQMISNFEWGQGNKYEILFSGHKFYNKHLMDKEKNIKRSSQISCGTE